MKKTNLTPSDHLLTLIALLDAKMEALQLVKADIENNRESLLLSARRLDIQHSLLQKMLQEAQLLLGQMRDITEAPPEPPAS